MECYDKALTLNPGNCDAYVARGAARANQRQFEGAVQDFEAALQIDPENANAAKYLQVKLVQLASACCVKRTRQVALRQ
jgi:tetratricopeptide (TPR) repeat protein